MEPHARPTKALEDGHRAAATVRNAGLSGRVPQKADHRAQVHSYDRTAQVVIPGEPVAQAMRQTQDSDPVPPALPRSFLPFFLPPFTFCNPAILQSCNYCDPAITAT